MSLRALWIALLLVSAVTSATEASTGIRVVGDSRFRVTAEERISAWLKAHGHVLTADTFDVVALNALDGCYLRDEPACANKLFVDSGSADLFLYVNFEVASNSSRERTVRGTLWLLRKEGSAQVFERQCNRCDDDAAEAMVDALTEGVGTYDARVGTLKLTSSPSGATVEIDGKKAGITPFSRELRIGKHEVTVRAEGYIPERRSFDIEVNVAIDHVVELRAPSPGSSRTRRLGMYGAAGLGAALVAGGTVALLLHEGSPCAATKKECFNGRPAGIAMLAGGGALLGVAGYLWFTMEEPDPMPAETLAPAAKGSGADDAGAAGGRPASRAFILGWGGTF
jgi:hypothetical protein